MTHVFVAPHPDDVALSCGGLIANLREIGQKVTIITVFSGTGEPGSLTTYQREALGFGSKTIWPATQAFNRASLANDHPAGGALPPWAATEEQLEATQEDADAAAKRFWQRSSWYRRAEIRNRPLGGQPLIDDQANQGPILTTELVEAEAAGDLMAARRLEDERYAFFAEASVVFLDLPDAVFRGYEGDGQLLGMPRDDDSAPFALLRQEIARHEPERVYLPLGIGDHVDHQLARAAGIALLGESRRWVMPGPEWTGRVVFYEDFPYAWWNDFARLDDLPAHAFGELPEDVSLAAELADIEDQLERKIAGISLYASQIDRLFGGRSEMAAAVRGFAARTAALGGGSGAAERYWVTTAV